MALQTTDLQYPIGRFSPADPVTRDQVDAWVGDIAALPADLRRAVSALTDERSWAALPDYRAPVAHSLDLLDALHRRWANLLRSLDWPQWQRAFVHPESGPATLAVTVGSYAWHGRHHLAHIDRLIAREGWTHPA